MTSLKHHLAVELRAKAFIEAVEIIYAPSLVEVFEVFDHMESDSDSLFDNLHIGALFYFPLFAHDSSSRLDPVVLGEFLVLLPTAVILDFDLEEGQLHAAVLLVLCDRHFSKLREHVLFVA